MIDPIKESIQNLKAIKGNDENRLAKIEALLKCVDTMSSETISFKINDDPFTKWDIQYVHVVKYIDGTVVKEPGINRMPSKQLHRMNSIMESWGFKLNKVGGHWENIFYFSYDEPGKFIPYFSIEMNTFHYHLFTIKGTNKNIGSYNYTYDESTVEEFLNKKIEELLEKHASVRLVLELKIRRLLN